MDAAPEDELQSDVFYLQAVGFTVTTVICFDYPACAIVDTVREQNIDLVAMATHSRTGVQGLVLSNVAKHVLRQVGVAVLLIRPCAEAHRAATV